jgi:hypothetical protein
MEPMARTKKIEDEAQEGFLSGKRESSMPPPGKKAGRKKGKKGKGLKPFPKTDGDSEE